MLPGVYLSTMQVSAWFDRCINTDRCCRIASSAIKPPSKTTLKPNSNNSVHIYARAHEIAPSIFLLAQASRRFSLGCVLLTSNTTTVGKYRKVHVMMSTQSRGRYKPYSSHFTNGNIFRWDEGELKQPERWLPGRAWIATESSLSEPLQRLS